MSEVIRKVWSDPVWSKVIASTIIAVAVVAGSYLLNWWPAIGGALAGVWRFFRASSMVPNWVLLLGGLMSIPSVLIAGALLKHWWSGGEPNALSWKSYVSDIYFNLKWRWRYLDDGFIVDVHTFCPHCDFQVYAEDVSSYRVVDHIAFKCDSCGRALGEFHESYLSLENKTKRFIQQKIRNGTWSN